MSMVRTTPGTDVEKENALANKLQMSAAARSPTSSSSNAESCGAPLCQRALLSLH